MYPVINLTKKAKSLGDDVYLVCKDILENPDFENWSGSSKEFQHHYGQGGLATHTSEVVNICFEIRELYRYQCKIDEKELFLSAFFHDVGKMHDYEPVVQPFPAPSHLEYSQWKSTSHKRMIHHISRSGIMWSDNAKKDKKIYDNYFEKVLHAILAHHTFREAGSPVAPKSRVAWMVTLCDNMSARMNDADTLDIVKHYK